MSKATAVNYTDDQVSKMINDYQAADSAADRTLAVKAIASEIGKTVKSVIAKLSREGVYVKAAKVTKSGATVVRKEAIVKALASTLEIDFSDIKSLGKATKADLQNLLKAIS